MADDVLVVRDASIGYRTRGRARVVAHGLNARLARGRLACLLGPNGAGKSTLMRTLAAMQAPLAGEIQVAGACLDRLSAREVARRVSVMLTDRVDAGTMSSYALVSLGRHPHTDWTGRLTAVDHARVRWALEVVGGVEFADRPIGELSDGERQKVMLARALAQETPLLLLDEITAFLDLPRRVEIMGMLHRLARESGCALLLSTHDLDLALRTADSIWLLSGDGTMRIGVPEEIVLSGALEAAFAGNRIAFDSRSGTFHARRSIQKRARVVGNGLHAIWTARALERLAYELTDDGQPSSVTIEVDAGPPPRWMLRAKGRTATSSSLRDVIEWVETID
jgi:iron complex transport system ATP-binding protein